MMINDLISEKNFNDIPKIGYILIVSFDDILFEKYCIEDGKLKFASSKKINIHKVKELHCFDSEIEYRLRIVNRGTDIIEKIMRKSEEKEIDSDLIYEDEMLIKPEYVESSEGLKYIKVINRFKYTYFDTLTLDNYRLSCEMKS